MIGDHQRGAAIVVQPAAQARDGGVACEQVRLEVERQPREMDRIPNASTISQSETFTRDCAAVPEISSQAERPTVANAFVMMAQHPESVRSRP